MHRPLRFVPLTLAVLVLSCQDGSGPTTSERATSAGPSLAAEVVRTRLTDGFLVHVTPEVTFTVGLVDPLSALPECGGTGEIVESDMRGFDQIVSTPPGPERQVRRFRGTVVLYDVSLFELDDLCDLIGHEVGTGQGTFTSTDNSVTGVGPGMNAFGFMANAILDLVDGGRAHFHAVVRLLFDGENVTAQVEKVELKPIGN
jgi:hypothetical protein